MPRSRSLTDRGERPAASASSSWVSPASVRSCLSTPANSSPGCSATAPTPQNPSAATGRALAGPRPKAYAGLFAAATPPAPASQAAPAASLASGPPQSAWFSEFRATLVRAQRLLPPGHPGGATDLCGSCVGHRVWSTRWPAVMVEPVAIPARLSQQLPVSGTQPGKTWPRRRRDHDAPGIPCARAQARTAN